MLRVSLEQWRAFVATGELGNFQRAAIALRKTPSAIGHSIRKMECSLQKTLFDIDGREVSITQVGKLLLPYARGIIAEAEAAERLCELACAECNEGRGEMPIAVDVAFPGNLLLGALADLAESYRDLSLRIHETSRTDVHGLFASGYVRLAITPDPPRSVSSELLLSVPLVCVVGRNHPLSKRRWIDPAQLADMPEVIVRDHPMHGSAKTVGRRFSFSHFERCLGLLRSGTGFAWLPRHVVDTDVAAGDLAILDVAGETPPALHLHVAFRERDEDCGAVLSFVSLLRDQVADHQEALLAG